MVSRAHPTLRPIPEARRIHMRTRASAILMALLILTPAAAWAQCQVIDDFSTGTVLMSLRVPNTQVAHTETGSMLGGVRANVFRITANQFFQPAELDAHLGGGPLVLTTGLRGFFREDLVYGLDTNFALKPLGYKPVGCDRFRIAFDSASQGLNFNIVPFQGPGVTPFQDGINLDPSPFAGNPFCVDFLFTNFTSPGTPQDFAGKGINAIDFVFQSGSAIGANEFAITKIETTDLATATANP